jgi:uncharacterized protein with PIN domain
MRFHLDENVDPAIAEGLRRRGIDVTTTVEAGLLSAGDQEQLRIAHAEGRVLITHDADFLRLHDRGVSHAGIVYSPKGVRSIGELVRGLVVLAECLTTEEMVDHVEYL